MTSSSEQIGVDRKHIAILGAGVIGLQTAISLLEAQKSYKVSIIAKHFSEDESIEYTSPWAGAMWRSHALLGPEDEEARSWDRRTYEHWMSLLAELRDKGKSAEEIEKETGLGIRQNALYWSGETPETAPDGEGLWWRDCVHGFSLMTEEERTATNAQGEDGKDMNIHFGAKFDTVCINVPHYLKLLSEKARSLGATFIRATIETNNGEAELLQGIKHAIQQDGEDIYAIVLATGLLSKNFLPKHEADKMFPIRGQTILVRGEMPDVVTHLFPSKDELTYVIPRIGSGVTVIGGCKQAGQWTPDEDKTLTRRILERAKRWAPYLLNKDGEFEVVSVQVGLRPGRTGGARVEKKAEGHDGLKVIYAYGHSGAGFQQSVGSAEKILRLLGTA